MAQLALANENRKNWQIFNQDTSIETTRLHINNLPNHLLSAGVLVHIFKYYNTNVHDEYTPCTKYLEVLLSTERL